MQWHSVENKMQIMQHVLNAVNVLVACIYKMNFCGFFLCLFTCVNVGV